MKNNNSTVINNLIRYAFPVCIVFFCTAFAAAKTAGTPVKKSSQVQKTESCLQLQDTGNVTIKIINAPGETIKNKPFASSYKISVADAAGNAVPDFNVTVSYPASQDNGTIVYDKQKLKTDENGIACFMPGVPEYSLDAEISFYPTPSSPSGAVVAAVHDTAVTAPYKVKTNFCRKTGLVYVFDFNEAGKPITNSPYILRDILNARIRAGNSPIAFPTYLSGSADDLYKATYKIVENPDMFMVCGSVKYSSPVEKDDSGMYECSLASDIYCIDMKDGSVIFRTQQTDTEEDSSKFKAVDDCRQALAEKTVHAVVYGM